MLMLKPKMLNLMFEGEIVATIRDGGVLNYDGIYVSPARAGWEFEGYSLVEAPPPEPEPVEPSTDPRDYPLRRWQFKAMVAYLGIHDAIEQAIATAFAEDVLEREKVLARYRESDIYNRSDPLFDTLAPLVGLSTEDLDAAWMTIATA